MNVRPAREDERLTVRRILDAAVLLYGDLDERELLVALEEGRVLGVLVLDGGRGERRFTVCASGEPGDPRAEIQAVAVRRRWRGQGIGRDLVDPAAQRRDRLVAEFGERVRPFSEPLVFDIESVGDGRYRGVLEPGAG
jgi:GNAT superfamily N-acetyltransferase